MFKPVFSPPVLKPDKPIWGVFRPVFIAVLVASVFKPVFVANVDAGSIPAAATTPLFRACACARLLLQVFNPLPQQTVVTIK